MIFNCPGSQKFKQPQPETIKCRFCGTEVEIWTDEIQAVCPNCKKILRREPGQSCLDWCNYAKECAGDKIYYRFTKRKNKAEKRLKKEE